MITCPWCNKKIIPSTQIINADNYGGGLFHFRCRKCSKVIKAWFERKIVIRNVEKSDRKEGDWG